MVSLELRASAVTELADVVFPVAAAPRSPGRYLNWEGRNRPFGAALAEFGGTRLDEGRILDTLGVEMDVDLYTQTPVAARADMGRLGIWSGSAARIDSGGADEAVTRPPAAQRRSPVSGRLIRAASLADPGQLADGLDGGRAGRRAASGRYREGRGLRMSAATAARARLSTVTKSASPARPAGRSPCRWPSPRCRGRRLGAGPGAATRPLGARSGAGSGDRCGSAAALIAAQRSGAQKELSVMGFILADTSPGVSPGRIDAGCCWPAIPGG